MRHSRLRRPRSRKWWGVFFFALLTMNSYVLFDILDVDGSQMTGWPGDDIIAAEPLQVEADKALRADLPAPGSAGLLHLTLSRAATMDSHGSPLPTTILRIRHSQVLPRVNLRREVTRSNSLSADPA